MSEGKVLVTGAGGFIGSHLVEHLVENGFEVRALMRYTSKGSDGQLGNLQFASPETMSKVEVLRGNIEDPTMMEEAAAGCRYIFHLAALIGIPYSYKAPQQYVMTNVLGTLNILEAARKHRVERTLVASTSEVYGSALYTPIDEKHPLQAQSPYSATKIGAEKLAQSYGLSFGLPVTVIRPFNTYGPRQSQRAVIPTIIAQALQGEKIKLGALDPLRDFNYVEDTARGFLLAARSATEPGAVFNIGSGRSVTIGQTVDMILNIAGKKLPVICDQERIRPKDSEVIELRCDASRAREAFGWQPRVSLEEGLSRTYQWFMDHPEASTVAGYAI